ncbi:PKL/CAK/Fmp29-like protein kinase subdomain-containing protein [Coprinopsis cinerea AmutBmut pab1-1]|nr:PKL/CAK/Fmp29-like protein kinase subdomain-containing protein [Coprinopsis cinerea AmutBmut pab1-1]
MQPSVSVTKPQKLPSDWSTQLGDLDIPLSDAIHEEWELSLGIDVRALVFAAMHTFGFNPSHPAPRLSSLTSGGYNEIFVATFAREPDGYDGLQVVIRIPAKNDRLLGRMEANVALMTYAKYCRGLPVPKVITWCDGTKEDGNPIGAPYIMMEHLDMTKRWRVLWDTYTPNWEFWYRMMDITSGGHASLARPLPFDGLGSLYFSSSVGDHKQGHQRETVEELQKAETYRLDPLFWVG